VVLLHGLAPSVLCRNNSTAQLEAVHFRHLDVRQDDFKSAGAAVLLKSLLEALDCLSPAEEHFAVEAQILDHGLEGKEIEVIVVNDQNLHFAQRGALIILNFLFIDEDRLA
jgi:hypothetical protein